MDVYGRRLKFFRNSSFEICEEIPEHLKFQTGELLTMERLLDIRRINGTVDIMVHWKGFDDCEQEWVDMKSLSEDLPEVVRSFLRASVNPVRR